MKYALGAAQMKEIDRYTIETIGIPSCVLMEKAAMAVVRHTKELCSKKDRILAVCGYGNNGGDGIAAARILHMQGYRADILMVGDALRATEETKKQLEIAKKTGVTFVRKTGCLEYTVVIDAVFGIGLTRPVEGAFKEIIEEINASEAKVIAVDVPSGISTDSGKVLGCAVKADVTVTFGYAKTGCLLYPGAEYAGRVVVEDIGFARDEAVEKLVTDGRTRFYYTETAEQLLPARQKASHKGSYGRVLVIAGSSHMSGAAYFCAAAAYRMGAGLVRVFTPEENREILLKQLPEVVLSTYTAEENGLTENGRNDLSEALSWATVVTLGPGLGMSAASRELVKAVLEHCREKENKPLLVDADGLNILAEMISDMQKHSGAGGSEQRKTDRAEVFRETVKQETTEQRIACLTDLLPPQTILTPHKKELSRLTGIPMEALTDCLIDSGALSSYNKEIVWVKKDARTIVSYRMSDYINVTGNDGMATAGSGDVLAGMIAGILAQGAESCPAATAGVYLHGMAGDIAAKRLGARAMLASDLVEAIPALWNGEFPE